MLLTMLPYKLGSRITSNWWGLETNCMDALSTIIGSNSIVGYSLATCLHVSKNNPSPSFIMFALWTHVTWVENLLPWSLYCIGKLVHYSPGLQKIMHKIMKKIMQKKLYRQVNNPKTLSKRKKKISLGKTTILQLNKRKTWNKKQILKPCTSFSESLTSQRKSFVSLN